MVFCEARANPIAYRARNSREKEQEDAAAPHPGTVAGTPADVAGGNVGDAAGAEAAAAPLAVVLPGGGRPGSAAWAEGRRAGWGRGRDRDRGTPRGLVLPLLTAAEERLVGVEVCGAEGAGLLGLVHAQMRCPCRERQRRA